MELVFTAAILILAAAIVLLFAMLGELNSRLQTLQRSARSSEVVPLEDALLGTQPSQWPEDLPSLDGNALALLVLSTACSSCQDVAQQLDEELAHGHPADIAVVVSTGDRRTGERFIKEYGLDRLPCHVDENGAWVREEFGIQMSPTPHHLI